MTASARIDELRHRYAAQPRRYFAPLANALREAGALEEAVTMLRAQLAEYPEHLTGYVVLGRALFEAGALADARVAFEAARTLDPGNRVVLRYLGEVASLGGDQEAARLWFGRLRAADPYADDVAAQLGGGPAAPPEVEDVAPRAPALDATQEVAQEVAPEVAQDVTDVTDVRPNAAAADGEPFELLDFDAITVEPLHEGPAADPASASVPEGEQEGADFDPVVGLDLAPQDPAADDEAAALGHVAAGPFATETMAGLLAAQGHTGQAIALYERLTAERPADAGLRARLDALRGGPAAAAPSESRETPAAETPAATSATPASARAGDAERGALLAVAFADLGVTMSASAVGPAADPAAEGLHASDPFAGVSFDHFFATEPPATREPPAVASTIPPLAPGPAVSDADADAEADLERFDAWLRDEAA